MDAEGNTWTFAYDPVGNRTLRVNANGQSTTYQYYPDNQARRISYDNGTSVAFTYEPNNNRLSMVDPIGTSAWNYDPLNRVTTVNDSLERLLKYGYDAVGNRTSLSYPDGRTVNYGYYKNDWLQSLTDPENGVTSYRRDGVGNTTQIVNPNQTFTGIQYDKANRILQIANQSKKLNSGFKYEYNEVGQRTKIQASYAWRTKDAMTTTYHYDGLRRLVRSEDSDGAWNAYEYDRAGNSAQDIYSFGSTLHMVQDSFSHYGHMFVFGKFVPFNVLSQGERMLRHCIDKDTDNYDPDSRRDKKMEEKNSRTYSRLS